MGWPNWITQYRATSKLHTKTVPTSGKTGAHTAVNSTKPGGRDNTRGTPKLHDKKYKLYTEFIHTPDLHLKVGTTNTHSLHQIHISSGQEEPSSWIIRQNWDLFWYVLCGTCQSIFKTCFDLIATKNVVKCCLNFLISIDFRANLKCFWRYLGLIVNAAARFFLTTRDVYLV